QPPVDADGHLPLLLFLLEPGRSQARLFHPEWIRLLFVPHVIANRHSVIMMERCLEESGALRWRFAEGRDFQGVPQTKLSEAADTNVWQGMADDLPVGVGGVFVLFWVLAGQLEATISNGSPGQRHQSVGRIKLRDLGKVFPRFDEILESICRIGALLP